MTTGAIIRLVLQLLVFAAWAYMLFRTLSHFRDRNAADQGGFKAQAKYWFSSDEDKTDRRTLFFLTFVLIAMNLTNILSAP